jgi:hypothetical protein
MFSKPIYAAIIAWVGTVMLIAFGYFATIEGIESAFHSPAVLLAVGALIAGGTFANTRQKRPFTRVEASESYYSNFRTMMSRFSAGLAITAAVLFFVEVNISLLKWREILGTLALGMYLISMIVGAVTKKTS